MKKYLTILFILSASFCFAEFDARREVIKLMKNSGMEKYLHAPVRVSAAGPGVLSITDEGIFAIQHELLSTEVAADANIVIDADIIIPPTVDKLMLVTHGWLDKGEKDWPSRMAAAVGQRVDPNEWLCASYDWKGGSIVITSVQAAEYARDIAGPRLAAAIEKLGIDFKHIHLLGHSAGSWTIDAAAKQLALVDTDAVFHLTFFDAYVPEKWDPDMLAQLFEDDKQQAGRCWADHYYTKDITWKVTQHNLKYAHNVDISDLDPLIVEHEFPYRWYMATITGSYDRWDEKKEPVVSCAGEIDYGFARSLESGAENWKKSRELQISNSAVQIGKNQ